MKLNFISYKNFFINYEIENLKLWAKIFRKESGITVTAVQIILSNLSKNILIIILCCEESLLKKQ